MPRLIAFLIYPEFQLLDAAGPLAAFEIAARYEPGAYALRVVATKAGRVESSSGASWFAAAARKLKAIDTLVIAGGNGSRAAAGCIATRRFVSACGTTARRVASVCSGAYLLAESGLLNGRRATTHWSRSADFAQAYPAVHLDADRIFVKDGKIWSSAGITAGIDLSLALIAEDLGEAVARRTAQQLVVYYRRPGGQSQFSALLEIERADGRFAELLNIVRSNLQQSLDVEELARLSSMSPRHFARTFRAEIGISPAKFVERLRVERARAALESGSQSIQRIADLCGFGSAERMRRSFLRVLGSPPSASRRTGDNAT
jgi:transcriptional regulator GlxA family with amidase domain